MSAAFCAGGGDMGRRERDRPREKMVGEGEEGKKERKEKQAEATNVLSTAAGSSVSGLHLQPT